MPLEPTWIAAAGGALLLLLTTLFVVRRRRRSPVAPPADPPPQPERAQITAGEREAAWSARRAAAMLTDTQRDRDRLQQRLVEAEREAALAETRADELSSAVGEADREIGALRRAVSTAEDRIAALETEIAGAARAIPDAADVAAISDAEIADLERELARLRDSVATHATVERDLRHRLERAERDLAAATVVAPAPAPVDQEALIDARVQIAELRARLAERETAGSDLDEDVARLTSRLQNAERDAERISRERDAARAEAERVRQSLRETREEADRRIAAAAAEVARLTARATEMERAAGVHDRDAARLVVRDAEIADLEARLAALAAARESELRRLNDKIASMERLYVEVEVRERRIEELEDEVKSLAESRDQAMAELARAERDLISVQGARNETVEALDRLATVERELVTAQTRVAELERADVAADLRAEIERLQGTLAGERDRNARLQRRLASAPTETAASQSYAEWDRRLRQRIDAAVTDAVRPLEDRIERLRIVIDEKERRIAALTAAGPVREPGPDDLKRIRGIGPKIEAILHDLGVRTFRDIASFSDQDVERVGAALPVYGRRILDDDWIGQARELAG